MLRIARRLVDATGPGLALQELMYGFIMELIFVTAARIGTVDTNPVHLVLLITGMNVTWGAIDAVVYYMIGAYTEMEHARRISHAKSGCDRSAAVEYLMDSFSGTPLDALRPEDERRMCEAILDCEVEDEAGLARDRRDYMRSSIGCFLITALTIIPVAVPILIWHDDVYTGLAVASALSSTIMLFVGYQYGRSSGKGPAMGMGLAAICWAITIVATFTGG